LKFKVAFFADVLTRPAVSTATARAFEIAEETGFVMSDDDDATEAISKRSKAGNNEATEKDSRGRSLLYHSCRNGGKPE